MAALHQIGELDMLILAAAMLLAALYTWVAHRLIAVGLHWSLAALIALLTMLASRYHLHARPHLFSIVFLGWTFARLVDFESGKIPLRALFWLPPAFVLWSNLHGGALGGLATVSLVIVGWLFAWLLSWPALLFIKKLKYVGWLLAWPLGWPTPIHQAWEAAWLLLVLAGCWLASLVNPYGWQLPRDWIALMGSPVLPKYMIEHMSPDFRNPYQQPILLLALTYVGLLLLVPLRKPSVTWLIPLVWFILTLQRVRHCTLFSITAAVALADIVPRTRLAEYLIRKGSWMFAQTETAVSASKQDGRWTRYGVLIVPGLAVGIAVLIQAMGLHVPLIGRSQPRTTELCPLGLLPALQKYEKQHPGAAIFNDMAYGGFLIYYTPGLRIFMDDRCELYGDEFLLDFFKTNSALLDADAKDVSRIRRFQEWGEQYGFDIALVRKTSGFDRYLESVPEKWRKVDEVVERIKSKTGEDIFLWGAVLYERKRTTRPGPEPPENQPHLPTSPDSG
jgi:hypothetical protein